MSPNLNVFCPSENSENPVKYRKKEPLKKAQNNKIANVAGSV